jgi:hypothetical protein
MKPSPRGRALALAVVLARCGGGGSSTQPTETAGPAAGPRTSNPVVPAFCGIYPQAAGAGSWQSTRVFYTSGRLTYASDARQNRIPDYSYAGYRYGEQPIPDVAEVMRLGPAAGDNTARIQQALDQLASRAPDANGRRGALVLAPGRYEIAGTVRVRADGIVLRGSGNGGDPQTATILLATGDTPHQRSVVVLGSGSTTWSESSARAEITTPFVQVGSLSFEVASAGGFAAGDEVVIHHPSTQAWINALGGGGDPPWAAGSKDIVYFRRITQVAGNTLGLDAPVYNHLDRSLAVSYVAKASWNRVRESGVESLRVDIQTAGGQDENHAWSAVEVSGAQDSWVRQVVALHFGYAGVITEGALRVTVEDCLALAPVAIMDGGRMYNFTADTRSQLVLFRGCTMTDGRHGYVTNGAQTASGIVFHRCQSTNGRDMEAGHRQWATGVLMDNLMETGSGSVRLINRGSYGTSHGWATAHSVSWRFNRASLIQEPPTAQNYGITDAGSFSTNYPFSGPTGHQERQAGALVPASLYEAQLCERIRP